MNEPHNPTLRLIATEVRAIVADVTPKPSRYTWDGESTRYAIAAAFNGLADRIEARAAGVALDPDSTGQMEVES